MKRRGFTLIELMVVIAIIIILAAIAIPNYLKMTERAKRSRLSSDFATLATVLETFKTDWGEYPTADRGEAVDTAANNIYNELSGAAGGDINKAGAYNAVGEQGPIEYIKAGTLTSMTNPFSSSDKVTYWSTDGKTWTVYAKIATSTWLVRTSEASTVVEAAADPEA